MRYGAQRVRHCDCVYSRTVVLRAIETHPADLASAVSKAPLAARRASQPACVSKTCNKLISGPSVHPTTNCVIKYPQSITKEKTLNNTSEAFELSANNHGVDQWWVSGGCS